MEGILNKISEMKFPIGTYGLAVIQTISNSTTIKNIDKITVVFSLKTLPLILFSLHLSFSVLFFAADF